MLIAFSMYTNGKKLFATKRSRSEHTMECLNGIRVFSALWVIYAHAHVMTMLAPTFNFAYIPEVNNYNDKNSEKLWVPERVCSFSKLDQKSLKMDHFFHPLPYLNRIEIFKYQSICSGHHFIRQRFFWWHHFQWTPFSFYLAFWLHGRCWSTWIKRKPSWQKSDKFVSVAKKKCLHSKKAKHIIFNRINLKYH